MIKGEKIMFLGHVMIIKKIKKDRITMSCLGYCCSAPNGIELKCSIEEFHNLVIAGVLTQTD